MSGSSVRLFKFIGHNARPILAEACGFINQRPLWVSPQFSNFYNEVEECEGRETYSQAKEYRVKGHPSFNIIIQGSKYYKSLFD